MYTYAPKLHHAMITAAFCLLLIALQAYTDKEKFLKACVAGAWIFFFLTVLVMYMLVMVSVNDQTNAQTDWMIAYAKLDDEGKAEMASHFPTMRYRIWRGAPQAYWGDTGVTIEQFKTFLDTSDKYYISPERNWNSAAMPRKAWQEIKDTLEAEGKVEPGSAAGSHSWKWVGNSYQHMQVYRMAGRELRYKDNSDTQVTGSTS